jgi:hypothetical protein
LRSADKDNRDRTKSTPRFGSVGSNLECEQVDSHSLATQSASAPAPQPPPRGHS